jgi:ribosomal protein S18 acetylase RimI-like enzyme
MSIDFRAAQVQDFEFCRDLYFARPEPVTPEQEAGFRDRWKVPEVRIITCDGADVGWLQSRIEDEALYLVQLFVDAPFQGRGIGTETLERLVNEAARAGRSMTLGVVKSNPARRLYERLGFEITHEDDRKFWMRFEV